MLCLAAGRDGEVRLWKQSQHGSKEWVCLLSCSAGRRQGRALKFERSISEGLLLCCDEAGRVWIWDTARMYRKCVCVCVREREREREEDSPDEDQDSKADERAARMYRKLTHTAFFPAPPCVCLCVCVSVCTRPPEEDLSAAHEWRKQLWRDRHKREADPQLGMSNAELKRQARRKAPAAREPLQPPITALESRKRRGTAAGGVQVELQESLRHRTLQRRHTYPHRSTHPHPHGNWAWRAISNIFCWKHIFLSQFWDFPRPPTTSPAAPPPPRELRKAAAGPSGEITAIKTLQNFPKNQLRKSLEVTELSQKSVPQLGNSMPWH